MSIPINKFAPIFNKPPFLAKPFQGQPPRKAPYPNKIIDDSLIKDFFGRLLSGSHAEIKEFLSKNNLPIGSIRDEFKDGPLHIILKMDDLKVSKLDKLEICKLLVKHGASMNLMNKQDLTPVHLASMLQYPDIVEYFVSQGANINSLTNVQQNALHLAIRPNITLCPSLNSSALIPQKDVKFRDVNNITKAIWNYLDKDVHINAETNVTKLYMLDAIKNIINNSEAYLTLLKGDDYIGSKREKLLQDIKKINTLDNTLTQQDKKYKVDILINDVIKTVNEDMLSYYKYTKDNMSFTHEDSFAEPIKSFSKNPDEKVIYGSGLKSGPLATYYKHHFDNALNKLDKKYDEIIDNIHKIIDQAQNKIKNIRDNVYALHIMNLSLQPNDNNTPGKTIHVGAHTYLNKTNVAEYGRKYNVDIASNIVEGTNYNHLKPLFITFINKYIETMKKKKEKIDYSFDDEEDAIKELPYTNMRTMLYIRDPNLDYIVSTGLEQVTFTSDDDNIIIANADKLHNTTDDVDLSDMMFTLEDVLYALDEKRLYFIYIGDSIEGKIPMLKFSLYFDSSNSTDFYNTSVLYSYFNQYYDEFDKYSNRFISQYNSKNDKYNGNKYNYYTVYNRLAILNAYYNEFYAGFEVIRDAQFDEGLNKATYVSVMESQINGFIQNWIFETRAEIQNDAINLKELNTLINNLVKILNLHQGIMMTYAFTEHIFEHDANFSDSTKYEMTYDQMFTILNKSENYKYATLGLFNGPIPSIPYIVANQFKTINKAFYENAYPTVNNLIFYLNKTHPTFDKTFPHFVVSENNKYNFTGPTYVAASGGKLLMNMDPKYITYGEMTIITQSMPDQLPELLSFPHSLYKENNSMNQTGIIGLEVYDLTKHLHITLLDATQIKILPFDLTDTYIDTNTIQKSDHEPKYFEMLLFLRRLFISQILTDKNKDKLKTSIINILQEQIPGHSAADLTNVANKIIAEGVDKFLMSTISAYIEQNASKIVQKIITTDKMKLIGINNASMPDKVFKMEMVNIDDILLNTIANIDEKMAIDVILDMDFINMETDDKNMEINEYTYKLPYNNMKEERMVYFKPDYTKMDLSIVKSEMMQCMINNPAMIQKLIELKIFVNQSDYWQKTPIMYAIEGRNSIIVKILLKSSPNIFYRNVQSMDIIGQALSLELTHQEMFINDKLALTMCENYKLMLNNIFESNPNLKKNIPKFIDVVNYLPIYIFNWQLNIKQFANLTELYARLNNVIVKNNNQSDRYMYLFNKTTNELAEYESIIQKYNNTTTNNPIVDAIKIKINKIDKMLMLMQVDKDKDKIEQLTNMKKKYEEKLDTFKDATPITFYNTLDNFVPLESNKDPIAYLNAIQKSTNINNIGIANTILLEMIKKYTMFNQSIQTENIHIILSHMYSTVLHTLKKAFGNMTMVDKNTLEPMRNDIKILEKHFKHIVEYLDTRYVQSTLIDNKLIDDLFNNVKITLNITLKTNMMITLKKLVYNHIIQTDPKNIQIITSLFKEYADNNVFENLIHDYCMLIMEFKQDSVSITNIEYKTIEKLFEILKNKIINNNTLIFPQSSIFVKNLNDHILPYYRTLFEIILEHIKKLLLNYIKYIINQYEGIKIIRMLLDNLIQ